MCLSESKPFHESINNCFVRNSALPAESIRELKRRLNGIDLLIVDGTEQRKSNPNNSEKQKYYSGNCML